MIVKNDSAYILLSGFENISGSGIGGIWLDATDVEVEDTWRWQATNEILTYFNWQDGSPHGGRSQNCLALFANEGKWSDGDCVYTGYSSVCEIENY